MYRATTPILKDLVLIGGGHAHVTVIKQLAMRPIEGLRLTLISPDVSTPYSGMLPGLIAGHYTFDEAHIDLQRLTRFARGVFVRGEVTGLDRQTKRIDVKNRPPIYYDVVSINAGSTPAPSMTPGAVGNVIPVKPVSEFLKLWTALKQRILQEPNKRIGVTGSGAGGIELVLSAQFAIDKMLAENGIAARPSYHVVTGSADVLETHNARVQRSFRNLLAVRNVEVIPDFRVDRVDGTGVWSGERHTPLDEIFWVTGAAPPDWFMHTGLDLDTRGFLKTTETLATTNNPSIFAAGDNSSIENHPRPKSGVFAVRQGPPLEQNLRNALLGKPLKPYRPQKAFLSLISTGDQNAIASWKGLTAKGPWVWRWKDRIDREFMDTFNVLPDMLIGDAASAARIVPTPDQLRTLGDLDMRCGGCAAKVGSDTLSTALSGLPVKGRGDVIVGLGSPDDATVSRVPAGRVVVQSTDSFRAMVDDPYLLGQIAANHCLGDLHAMGAEPMSALSVIGLPHGLPDKNAALLRQILLGAVQVFNDNACELAGGHTSETAELTVGFAVTGTTDETQLLRKTGLQPGDQLILTKALGTGVIFAADMRAKAKGRWVYGAIEAALRSSAPAASILRDHGARAATDITGFGLAGHAREMAQAGGVSVMLKLDTIAALDGALALLAEGLQSSLHTQNAMAVNDLVTPATVQAHPKFQLLFDPQTAGGLLAGVPNANADTAIKALHAAGYTDAAIIGAVVASTDPDAPAIRLEV